jgi:hypothetical protein
MGSVVEYRCDACAFSTGKLSVGWGKAGRGRYWGGLARCTPCKAVEVVDLSSAEPDFGGRRCGHCGGSVTLLDGMSTRIPCPRCNVPMEHARLGSWM